MRLLHNRRVLLGVALAVLLPSVWLLAGDSRDADSDVVAPVTRGEFAVVVTISGELRARNAVQISGPANAQQAQAYQMKIASLVAEGTVVASGDVVAQLDRSTLASKVAEVSLAAEKASAVYEQAMLDSTLSLSKAREEMRTMELVLEEKQLAKQQSAFEAPTVQRQAAIDLEKAERALAQARIDYKTKTEQARAKMREVSADVDRQRNLLQVVLEVMEGFTIRAPAPGMVIYVKEWNGKKRTVGSQVSSWDSRVATLPDLTEMESLTYVNEIDVRKIAVGQPAVVTLDSDPSKHLVGRVTSVANVGEQRPNADAKVFEVVVLISEADTTLRPGMTTGNAVETFTASQQLSIPLEAVYNEDGITFAYHRSGSRLIRQEIIVGLMNDDVAVVERGLDEGDLVLLSAPARKEGIPLVRLSPSTGDTLAPVVGGDTASTVVPLTTDSAKGLRTGSPARMPPPTP